MERRRLAHNNDKVISATWSIDSKVTQQLAFETIGGANVDSLTSLNYKIPFQPIPSISYYLTAARQGRSGLAGSPEWRRR